MKTCHTDNENMYIRRSDGIIIGVIPARRYEIITAEIAPNYEAITANNEGVSTPMQRNDPWKSVLENQRPAKRYPTTMDAIPKWHYLLLVVAFVIGYCIDIIM